MSDRNTDRGAQTDGAGEAVEADVDELQARVARVREEVGKRIIGQREVVEQLLVCIVADGNALLESNPGLGKTTLVRTVADATDLSFSRIQNTPDLMPSDITGTEIIQESGDRREFVFEKGPIFANVVLADEINRATPKTQAAMLEAMQERQVTAAGDTYQLPRPFFVLATQNPIDQGGTYPLPEAQTDRFLLKIVVDYPGRSEERDIVRLYAEGREPERSTGYSRREKLRAVQSLAREIPSRRRPGPGDRPRPRDPRGRPAGVRRQPPCVDGARPHREGAGVRRRALARLVGGRRGDGRAGAPPPGDPRLPRRARGDDPGRRGRRPRRRGVT
jgi:MoxR-like ATPases